MKTKVNDLSAKDYSIGDYLKESKKFLIPRYQRSYAWEKPNYLGGTLGANLKYYKKIYEKREQIRNVNCSLFYINKKIITTYC